jgi:site-specific DNA-methyltransferase (adenine-specific)
MISPVYDENGITIFQGDCFEVMTQLQNKSLDLLITDPPYGVDFKSNNSDNFEKIENDLPTDRAKVDQRITKALKLLKEARHFYVFGEWDYTHPTAAITELIWDKKLVGMGALENPWGPAHEKIWFGSTCSSISNIKKGYGKLSARMRKGSVISEDRKTGLGAKRHPTEKPVNILRQLIESSSVIGETVFDPFMGVGSTLVAAIIEGRNAIGIELSQNYVDIAIERVKMAQEIIKEVKSL